MVDSIKPSYVPLRPNFAKNRVKRSTQVETNIDGKAGQDYIFLRDRRKRKDRRNERVNARGIFDMRSGRGRRKNDPNPNIEVKV